MRPKNVRRIMGYSRSRVNVQEIAVTGPACPTREGNVNIENGAEGVRYCHFSQRTRKSGHFVCYGRKVKVPAPSAPLRAGSALRRTEGQGRGTRATSAALKCRSSTRL
jgi:hypothetical protein